MNDKYLVEKILQNNDVAFSLLIEKYQGLVFNTCYRLLNNYSDAQDISQDVFLEVYRSIDHLRNRDDLSGWLFRIAYSKSISLLRKKNPAKASSNTEFDVSINQLEQIPKHTERVTPERTLEEKESKEVLFKAIDKLPANQKRALLLHKFEGHSHKEICEIMDLTQASVESLIYRAKIYLRKSLAFYFKNI